MGVHQLHKFMVNSVPNGTAQVNIIDECQRFQRENNDQRPTLVIDLMGLLSFLCKDKAIMMCGGRHQIYRQSLEELLQKLSSVADLVFVRDGPMIPEKIGSWFEKQNERYASSIKILESIYLGQPLLEIIEKYSSKIGRVMTNMSMVHSIVRKFGTFTVAMTKECDAEIARYATNNPLVLAVLADDTDFLIYPGIWRYFSLKEIDPNNMTILEFSRTALRSFLDLNDSQLVILSTLAGNDVILHKQINHFHKKFGGWQSEQKFPSLASYIKENLTQSDDHLVREISKTIWNKVDKRYQNQIRDSLNLYNINFSLKNFERSNPLLHFCIVNYFNFCAEVIRENPIRISSVFKDMRKSDFPNYFDIITKSIARQIGVILQHKRMKPGGIHYEIIIKKSHDESFAKHYVNPEYPEIKVPDLIEFLDRNKHPEHDELRFNLLKWIIDVKNLEAVDLTTIPKQYFLDVLILTYLVHKEFISSVEADLILLTIKKVENNLIPNDIVVPTVLNERAFRISFLFLTLYVLFEGTLEAVGLIGSMQKIMNFDGVFFHQLYLSHMDSGFNPTDELKELDHFRFYK